MIAQVTDWADSIGAVRMRRPFGKRSRRKVLMRPMLPRPFRRLRRRSVGKRLLRHLAAQEAAEGLPAFVDVEREQAIGWYPRLHVVLPAAIHVDRTSPVLESAAEEPVPDDLTEHLHQASR